jgi:exopolysaccharide biosynthesis polyprenyl glycosylphosphotransferase
MIHTRNTSYTSILIVGDLLIYFFSLIVALWIRYSAIPGRDLIYAHLAPFSILFLLYLIINFGAGLYNKRSLLSPSTLPGLIIRSQIIAVLISVTFFYFAPVAISPKANLFIFAVVSTIALGLWRIVVFPVLSSIRKQKAIIIGQGHEVDDLYEEVNMRSKYGMFFVSKVKPSSNINENLNSLKMAVENQRVSIIVADFGNRHIESTMPLLYSLIFSGVQVMDISKMYEAIFDRVPLSMIGERWLVDNIGTSAVGRGVFDFLKRVVDIITALILGILSLPFYIFVYIGIMVDDKGPLFIKQNRVGRNGKLIRIIKFRSMAPKQNKIGNDMKTSHDDGGKYMSNGNGNGKSELQVTKFGKFIRMTRIDELPQLWNVLVGDISLIGPRPELPALVEIYEKEIPHYQVRHLVQPGLSGWAQIYHQAHPHHEVAVGDTRDKLSYDLYYVKNRSFLIDLKVALQTLKALISRRGV